MPLFANARTISNAIDTARMKHANRMFNSGDRVLTKSGRSSNASSALSSAPMSAATRTILRRASSRVATLNSSGVGEVRVDLRSGRIAAPPPPPLQFEGLAKKAMQYAPMTVEESLFIIEQSLANGQLKATEAVMTGVRLLRKQVAREEEVLLREALHA